MKNAAHIAAKFTNDEAARDHLESVRWPNGPVCPHCGGVERNSRLTAKVEGKGARPGLLFCGDCRSQFSVTVGTVFEDSKLPLHKWVYANHLICSSKKGISSKQLQRMLSVSYKTAWFIAHRIRLAMAETPTGKLGGGGKAVEVDETYISNKVSARAERSKAKTRKGPRLHDKSPVFALVERSGKVRAFHVARVTNENVKAILNGNVEKDTHLMTDEATRYWNIGKEYAEHSSVNHRRKEYVRGNVTTNTIEGFFGVLKRGLNGVYQHVSVQHLQRYVSEFEFRYNNRESLGVNDEMRAEASLKGIEGKRLTYRRINASA